jgi:UDP-N-acetylmuramyl pentapeptide phosphotransferase/UDP-N-acetylglucosamine-1-phosphate transferase
MELHPFSQKNLYDMLKINFVFYLISLILGGIGAWKIGKWGYLLGLLDKPNDRSSHSRPTPKGGGIGILAAFIFSSLVLKLPLAFWTPAALLALISLYGDKYDLSPKIRLSLQVIAALILVKLSAIIDQLSVIFIFFFMIFIVANANWYNFMDGINGIAGITGIVGFSLLVVFNILSNGDARYSILSICIAFSCLGFLPFNFPKAKVFMGDVGSILLGFVFASLVVLLSNNLLDFLCLVSFLFPFYADELMTMAVRIKDGENLFKPHRRHLYQLLANEMHIPHWKVSVGYGILQIAVGVSALLIRPHGIFSVVTLLAIFFCLFAWANYFVRARIFSKFMR